MEQIIKLILTTNLDDLSDEKLIEKIKAMIKAELDYPTYVPGLNPAPDVVTTKIEEVETLKLANKLLKQQQKENTGRIKDIFKDVKNDLTSKWANQAQNTAGMDKNKAALLGFGVKGQDDGHAEPAVSILNSNPLITEMDGSRHLEHTLTIRNNVTGKISRPEDAAGTDVFLFIGKDEPVDFRKSSTYLGRAKRGKYTSKFAEDQMGLTVWYYVVYVARKDGNGNLLASKIKTVVA